MSKSNIPTDNGHPSALELMARVKLLEGLLRKRPASELPADGELILIMNTDGIVWSSRFDSLDVFGSEWDWDKSVDGWWPISHLINGI